MLLHELSLKHNLPLVHMVTVLNIVAMFGPISRKDVLLRLLAEDAKLEPVFAPGLEHCMALLQDWTDDEVAALTLDLEVRTPNRH